MASALKAQSKIASKIEAKESRKKQKQKRDVADEDEDTIMQEASKDMVKVATSTSETKKRNKQRVLLLCSRGVTHRMRHLMNDLEALLPQVKKDSKLDSKNNLGLLPELADLNNCNNTLKDAEWTKYQNACANIHTMDELKMTGNCLKGSRGIVSFDKAFDDTEWGRLVKEVFTQIFCVPPLARRSKPFIDHILTFSLLDGKIWFRNFQIMEKNPEQPNAPAQTSLVEIGPRFVLTPIKIFEGAFNGATVYSNPEFVTPTAVRSALRRAQGEKYRIRKGVESERADRRELRRRPEDELAVSKVFS
ncbi:Ribosome biogenesis protein brx1 [Serendipita indica DSM 11827]|nr:Ribosome biogenesis protein brx1 [Serendipita indica DSM 11827]